MFLWSHSALGVALATPAFGTIVQSWMHNRPRPFWLRWSLRLKEKNHFFVRKTCAALDLKHEKEEELFSAMFGAHSYATRRIVLLKVIPAFMPSSPPFSHLSVFSPAAAFWTCLLMLGGVVTVSFCHPDEVQKLFILFSTFYRPPSLRLSRGAARNAHVNISGEGKKNK